MKEPKRIPLTDNPRCKDIKKIPLRSDYPEAIEDDIYIKQYEDNSKNNSESIQSLESKSSN